MICHAEQLCSVATLAVQPTPHRTKWTDFIPISVLVVAVIVFAVFRRKIGNVFAGRAPDAHRKPRPSSAGQARRPPGEEGHVERLFADQEDERHGEYIVAQVKKPKGGVVEMEVTRKWARIQERKEQMDAAPEEWVQINFIGPRGGRIEILKIGEEIDAAIVDEFLDPDTGQLYGFYMFQAGQEQTQVVIKSMWDIKKQQLAALQPFIDSEVHRAMDGDGLRIIT